MTCTFVIPDIHGMANLLDIAIDEISKRECGRVIFTGDFIDRGDDSRRVVQTLIDGPKSDRFKWSFIRGNHEDMALHCADGTDIEWWVQNGGGATLSSYGGEIYSNHLGWFDKLPRLLSDENRVYVHAGVDESFSLDAQLQNTTQWHRYGKGDKQGYRGMHVVHGHTPIEDGPELLPMRTNLDTGAFFTGRLVVGVFEDGKAGGPVDFIEVKE